MCLANPNDGSDAQRKETLMAREPMQHIGTLQYSRYPIELHYPKQLH